MMIMKVRRHTDGPYRGRERDGLQRPLNSNLKSWHYWCSDMSKVTVQTHFKQQNVRIRKMAIFRVGYGQSKHEIRAWLSESPLKPLRH